MKTNEKIDEVQQSHWKYHGRRTIDTAGAFFVPCLREGMRGLDAGCGTGSITASMLNYVGLSGRVTGVDINAQALDAARAKYCAEGLEFVVGNLYDLPFGDDVFDFVFSHGVLIHCREPLKVLGQLYRVLKSGGTIGISAVDHDSMLIYPDDDGLLMESVKLQEELWRRGSGWGSTPDEGSNLRLGKTLPYLLSQAGFSNVKGFARCEYYGDKTHVAENAESEICALKAQSFVGRVLKLGLATQEQLGQMIKAWEKFSVTDGAFRAKIICEAVAEK